MKLCERVRNFFSTKRKAKPVTAAPGATTSSAESAVSTACVRLTADESQLDRSQLSSQFHEVSVDAGVAGPSNREPLLMQRYEREDLLQHQLAGRKSGASDFSGHQDLSEEKKNDQRQPKQMQTRNVLDQPTINVARSAKGTLPMNAPERSGTHLSHKGKVLQAQRVHATPVGDSGDNVLDTTVDVNRVEHSQPVSESGNKTHGGFAHTFCFSHTRADPDGVQHVCLTSDGVRIAVLYHGQHFLRAMKKPLTIWVVISSANVSAFLQHGAGVAERRLISLTDASLFDATKSATVTTVFPISGARASEQQTLLKSVFKPSYDTEADLYHRFESASALHEQLQLLHHLLDSCRASIRWIVDGLFPEQTIRDSVGKCPANIRELFQENCVTWLQDRITARSLRGMHSSTLTHPGSACM